MAGISGATDALTVAGKPEVTYMKLKKALRKERKDLLFLARLLNMSPDHALKWLLRIPVGAAKIVGDFVIWRRTSTVVSAWDMDADEYVYQGPLTQLLQGAET